VNAAPHLRSDTQRGLHSLRVSGALASNQRFPGPSTWAAELACPGACVRWVRHGCARRHRQSASLAPRTWRSPRIDPPGSQGACSPRPARTPARQRHRPGRAPAGSTTRRQKEPALQRKRPGTPRREQPRVSGEWTHRLNRYPPASFGLRTPAAASVSEAARGIHLPELPPTSLAYAITCLRRALIERRLRPSAAARARGWLPAYRRSILLQEP
jgi:hypothetical protein